jgi:lysine-N-methylase
MRLAPGVLSPQGTFITGTQGDCGLGALVQQTDLVHPSYADSFRCIGSDCEDTCCKGWTIPVDQETIEKHRRLPASPLLSLCEAKSSLSPEGTDLSKPVTFVQIRMTDSQQCPLLSEDRLCRLQTEYGWEYLPSSCATYPRIVHRNGDRLEAGLTLSCPEAARLVLLDPTLFTPRPHPITQPLCNSPDDGSARSLQPWFWSIREFVLVLIRNRAYPLWQRLFLLGIFCRRLDDIVKAKKEASTLPVFIRDFEAAIVSGPSLAALDALPIESALQLDVVLRLAGMLLHRSNAQPRFADCVQAFGSGIGNSATATFESITTNYVRAHDRFYAPFFDRHPHILENYLINTVFRCQFPFGRAGMEPSATPTMLREYALLTGQFALMKGLLIGVAGHHREAFSTDHVVHTVQTASKHFEHNSEFLDGAYTLLVESKMDAEMGSLILLRNSEPTRAAASLDPVLPIIGREPRLR